MGSTYLHIALLQVKISGSPIFRPLSGAARHDQLHRLCPLAPQKRPANPVIDTTTHHRGHSGNKHTSQRQQTQQQHPEHTAESSGL